MKKIFLFIFLLLFSINICLAADTKVTGLTEITDIQGTDVIYVVDDPGGTPASRKITATNLFDLIDTSSKLAGILTDEEGTGAVLFASQPSTEIDFDGSNFYLPRATSCPSGAEANLCWDEDDEVLYIGDGAGPRSISNPFGSTIDDTELTNEDFGDFTCTGSEDGCTVDANAIALATDTTGNYVASITAGAGLSSTGATSGENISHTLSTASSETDFLVSGALTCGASTQGKAQVHTTPLQYCDNAATPTLRYSAYGASDGDALAGDSATSFFDAGTIEHERGGLEADVSGYSNGLFGTDGTNTIDVDTEAELETALGGADVVVVATDDITSANLRTTLSDESGTGAAIFAGGAIGAATATTPSADDNDTSVATTAYVQGEINGAGGTDLTCSSGQCNVDDAFVQNDTNDTMTGALTIDGQADTTQQIIEGHSTQTQHTWIVRTSAGASVATVDNSGVLRLLDRLQLGSITDGSATCIETNSDRPYADKNCNGSKESGEEFLDQVGSGSPGGSDTQIQYNNSSSFGGVSGFTTDGTNMTGTGTLDMGGGVIEIANGTGPTVDTAGQVAVDTTDDQFTYYGGAKRVLSYKYNKSMFIENPVIADDFPLWKTLDPITITDIECIVDPAGSGDSAVIDVRECNSTADSCITVDATITCDNDGASDDGTLSNGAIDANDWLNLDVGAVGGGASQLTVTIYYTIDAE